jgi:hypothetical protein
MMPLNDQPTLIGQCGYAARRRLPTKVVEAVVQLLCPLSDNSEVNLVVIQAASHLDGFHGSAAG